VQVPDEEFFYPIEFRKQDDKNKQGSIGLIEDQDEAMDLLHESYKLAYRNYLKLLDLGVCREQARSLLPVGSYSKAIWTASLQAIMNFLELRLDHHAQKEIRDYAEAVLRLTSSYFPQSMELIRCQDALNVEKPFKD
jgi:thymidylate synthase (FAD)